MAVTPSGKASEKIGTEDDPIVNPVEERGLTGRALVVAVALAIVAGFWVRQSEIIVLATQITESVPAIPGLGALVLLLFVNVILRRLPHTKPFSRGELLVVFLFVTISSTVMGIGIMQFLFALMTVPFYYSADDLPTLRPLLPAWLMPHNVEAIRRLYERAPDGRVPWELWWQPGILWLVFFFALWWTMYCLMTLFYRAWADEEKLSFPLVFLPMEMVGSGSNSVPFFRNRIMWAGFAMAAVYNLVNILHAFYPSAPAFGKSVDIAASLPDLPWSAISPFSFHFRPELIGLGYLVSTDISLTIWLGFIVLKLGAVFAASHGYEPHGLYIQEQGIGAYLVLAVTLFWQARRHLWKVWRSALSGTQEAGVEGISYRAAYTGLIGGFVFVCWFVTKAGMAWWFAVAYMAVVLSVALVYGRIRGQTGVPLAWLFPFAMPKSIFLYTLGSQPLYAGGPTTMPVWSLFSFLSRGYYTTIVGYQVEGMEMARRANIRGGRVVFALCLAVVVGFVVGWVNHLVPYYQLGALHREDGIWGSYEAIHEYTQTVTMANTHKLPELLRVWATAAGGGMVLLLWLLHMRFAGFPFHPLGYAMTCSYGDLLWGSFLVVWIVKSLALRYGGMRFYRQTVPFFLGFALGHLATAGIFWGVVGAWSGEAVKGYQVYFG